MSKRIAYNIYCDESYADHSVAKFMVIGGLFVNREMVPEIKERIKKIQEQRCIKGELKWVKTSSKTTIFYTELFTYLFSLPAHQFAYRCIVVDQTSIDYKKYHKEDKELAFYKFYYQLLKHRIEPDKDYYISLDFKPTRSKNRVRRLKEFLSMVIKNDEGEEKDIIKHLQAYDSKENIFIQIADVITGAIAFSKNSIGKSSDKKKLVNIIANSIGKENLIFCSSPGEKRFNIFCIIPGKNK